MNMYLTRLCWNDHQWERPSGSAPKLETASFSTHSGFGFEEWLFSNSIKDVQWQYGFLQGVNKAQAKMAGSTISVYLFAIGPEKKRYLIGMIKECQVLTQDEADAAHQRLAKNGAIAGMVEDVLLVDGDRKYIESKPYREKWTLEVINIRYRTEDAIRYPTPIEAVPEIGLKNLWRYQLYNASVYQIDAWKKLANGSAPLQSSGSHPLIPEELSGTGSYFEGSVEKVLVNRYERDRRARVDCIQHYGTNCAVCEINFGEQYGSDFKGLIHVHHLKPISELGANYLIDPIKDLRPICPNCHAMVHFGNMCRSITELRAIVSK